MKISKEAKDAFVSIVIAMIIVLCIGTCMDTTRKQEKTNYCKIDSVYNKAKYEFSPELVHMYHTDCGFAFSSNNHYKIGDSIQVKTILIEK